MVSINSSYMSLKTLYDELFWNVTFNASDYEAFQIWQNKSANLTFPFDYETVEGAMHHNRDAISVILPITIFYCVIFLVGILGNVATCIVIAQNKAMHTATNYYLFNLAVSDVLLLVFGMPSDIYSIWYPAAYPFNQIICVLQGVLSETATNATVLTITSFTIERYIAICFPFRSHTMSKLSRAIKFIVAIWILAFCLAAPQALQFGVVPIGLTGQLCTVKNRFMEHAFAVSGFVFFVGPMTIICVLYILIGIKLRKSKLLHNCKRNASDIKRGINAQSRVIRMLIAVVVTFFICWAPFHAQRLMAVYNTNFAESILYMQIYTILNYISGVLYFLSTCINPFLYNIMSHKFRNASKLTLSINCGGCSSTRHNRNSVNRQTYSAVSKNGVCAVNAVGGGGGGSFKLMSINNDNNNTRPLDISNESEFNKSLLKQSAKTKVPANYESQQGRCISVCSQTTIVTTISRADHNINNGETKLNNHSGSNSISNGSSKLGSIAEKVRRGTRKVLHFNKSTTAATAPINILDVSNRPDVQYKIKKHSSVDSNTISNSSLQEMAEEEYTSIELARFMGEINSELR